MFEVWTVKIGGHVCTFAAWEFENPEAHVAEIAGLLGRRPGAVTKTAYKKEQIDAWLAGQRAKSDS